MKVSIIVTKKKQYTQVQHTRGLAVKQSPFHQEVARSRPKL